MSAICHCDCPSDRWTLAYNIASMLPVVGGILTAAIGTHIILGCLTRAGESPRDLKIAPEFIRNHSLLGMPDGRMGRVKWLLITAIIMYVTKTRTPSRAGLTNGSPSREILALLVATSVIAPLVNQLLKPFERVARMVEIHFLMVIYFRTHPGEAKQIALELRITDVQGFEDRMLGNAVEIDSGKKQKGTKKKRKREKTNDSAV